MSLPQMLVKIAAFFTIILSFSTAASELKTGDILLQPLNCWSCSLIQQQESSNYSHIGMYLELAGKSMVIEAYGKVQLVSLDKFLAKTASVDQVRDQVKVMRTDGLDANMMKLLGEDALKLVGNPYDAKFLWDNYINEQEALYCSELVYKLLVKQKNFLNLEPKVMLFDINPEYWDRFFRGDTPRGKQGISPEDFQLSSDFYFVNYL